MGQYGDDLLISTVFMLVTLSHYWMYHRVSARTVFLHLGKKVLASLTVLHLQTEKKEPGNNRLSQKMLDILTFSEEFNWS